MHETPAIAREAETLATRVGLRVRDELTLVEVHGDDRLSWLNGQLTADVRKATAGVGVYALAVTVRGKIMADAWVVERSDHLAIALPASTLELVLDSFDKQIIMDDVTLRPAPELRVISLQGPLAREAIGAEGLAELERNACDELGLGGLHVLVQDSQLAATQSRLVAAVAAVGGTRVSFEGAELARLRRGVPRFGADFGLEQYPQEAGLEQRAVAFDKGCYLGQEVVCTLESRGRLTRHLVRLAGRDHAPAPGAPLLAADGTSVGQITSAAVDDAAAVHALGYLKRAQLGAAAVSCEGRDLRVLGPVG